MPVLNRPQNVVPLVESFVASNTPGRLVFVCQADDTRAQHDAVNQATFAHDNVSSFWTSTAKTWPQKINVAFQFARHWAEWCLLAADDVTFHEGWFEQTAALRAQPEICVIGTNDLGNPAVLAGEHATHPLVRSSYLGTVDRADWLIHEGYRHWFCDNEFIVTAKIRGCWAPCLPAVVEHNHPYWQKGEWDNTYSLGEENAVADKKLWESRIPLLQEYADRVML